MSNPLDPDQTGRSVEPDQGPTFLQSSAAGDKIRACQAKSLKD